MCSLKRFGSMPLCLLTAIAVFVLQVPVHAQEVSHPEYMEVAKNVRLAGQNNPAFLARMASTGLLR
jgi:hypothetical protein